MRYLKLFYHMLVITFAMYIVRPVEAVYKGLIKSFFAFNYEFQHYMWDNCKDFTTKELYKAIYKTFKESK